MAIGLKGPYLARFESRFRTFWILSASSGVLDRAGKCSKKRLAAAITSIWGGSFSWTIFVWTKAKTAEAMV